METDLTAARADADKIRNELQAATQRINSSDTSQIAKNAHIEKLTAKLNHSISCIEDSWHHDITKADFVDLTVSTRLMLEDTVWCLIRWRHKLPDIPLSQVPSKSADSTVATNDDKGDKAEDTDNGSNGGDAPSSVISDDNKKKRYRDEYFWSSQKTYLAKVCPIIF